MCSLARPIHFIDGGNELNMTQAFTQATCMLSSMLLLAVAGNALAQEPAIALSAGRDKFVQCASCHGSDGRSTVMPQYPKIGGQSAAYVVNALKAYRDGRRQGTFASVMAEVAKPLTDADIANLAAYIESL
jgi:cytochrome c553